MPHAPCPMPLPCHPPTHRRRSPPDSTGSPRARGPRRARAARTGARRPRWGPRVAALHAQCAPSERDRLRTSLEEVGGRRLDRPLPPRHGSLGYLRPGARPVGASWCLPPCRIASVRLSRPPAPVPNDGSSFSRWTWPGGASASSSSGELRPVGGENARKDGCVRAASVRTTDVWRRGRQNCGAWRLQYYGEFSMLPFCNARASSGFASSCCRTASHFFS